jgi:putative DNA methylase
VYFVYFLPIDSAFDTSLADNLARFETFNKHHYRPNSYLHKWWARRCGSTFRMILKGLVENNDLQGYYSAGGLEGKVILDPMMGGGTTLHEAIRLGANVIGSDIDPIPFLQARATLSDIPLSILTADFDELVGSLQHSLGSHFQTSCPVCNDTVPFWYTLNGVRRRCACREVLMVDSFVMREKPDGQLIQLCSNCSDLIEGEHHCTKSNRMPVVEKNQTHCEICGNAYREILENPYYKRYEMVAIAGHCHIHGLFFKAPDLFDRQRHKRANEMRSSINFSPDDFRVGGGQKSIQLIRRGIEVYLDLFSSRQLLYIHEAIARLPSDDPEVRLNLALLLSTSLEFNSLLCGYKGVAKRRSGAVRHAFAHHGYSFPSTALEINPIYPRRASGTLQKLFYDRLWRARRWAQAPKERILNHQPGQFAIIEGEQDFGQEVHSPDCLKSDKRRFLVRQASAVSLDLADGSIDAVVTDPPYFDSIQYDDLAEYFRVWLRQMIPSNAEWTYDRYNTATNPEGERSNSQYLKLMSEIFAECHRVLQPDTGRLIFTFHHWDNRAWSALTTSLYRAGFCLLNRYVVHAEHPMSVHIKNVKSLTHDAILVLAARQLDSPYKWEQPEDLVPSTLSRSVSYHFTENSATFLGWVLDQPDLGHEDIHLLWIKFFNRSSHSD